MRLCWEPLQQDARPLMVLVQIVGAKNRWLRRDAPCRDSVRIRPACGSPTRFSAMSCACRCLPTCPRRRVYQVEVGLIDRIRMNACQRLRRTDQLGTNFMEPLKIAAPGFVEPPIEHALNHRLGDQFELMGYDLDRSTVKPGESISAAIVLESAAPPGADYTVFAQVRDAANHIVAQKDDPPQAGAYPTSFWDAGEVVIDDRVIEIPAKARSGHYPIKIGLYRPIDGTRLMIDGDPAVNEITLPIEIGSALSAPTYIASNVVAARLAAAADFCAASLSTGRAEPVER